MDRSHWAPSRSGSAFVALVLLLATVVAPASSTCSARVQSTRHALLRLATAITRPASVRPDIVAPLIDSEQVQNERNLPYSDVVAVRVVCLMTSRSASLPAPPHVDAAPQSLRI